MAQATVVDFGLQTGTTRTLYAVWQWNKNNTEEYQVRWSYDTGDGVWFRSSDTTVAVNLKQTTYNAPDNAKSVRFTVRPVAKKHKVNGKEVAYWTADWSTTRQYNFADNPPSTPPVPEVGVENYTLRASLDNLNINATSIEFQIVANDTTLFKQSVSTIQYVDTDLISSGGYVTYTCYIQAGVKYKVRCRAKRGTLYSEWTEYSSNVTTIPAAPTVITECKADSGTSVLLKWDAAVGAKTYTIEYTDERKYFSASNQTSTEEGIDKTTWRIIGLESGKEYFFRVKAINEQGESGWSDISSVVLGKKPSAPTTWSSTTTCITGDPLTLYWMHNSEDGSTQKYAELEIYVNGVKESHIINSANEEDDKKTTKYAVDTSSYVEGTIIEWRVRTAGVTNEYGDWSIQRKVDIYAPATIVINITNQNGESISTLTSFPFYISGSAGPNTQTPISYQVEISANETYETVDNIGNQKIVSAGDTVYSKFFDTSEALLVKLSAGNIDLENNIHYTVTCIVAMNSGLTAESSLQFIVSWTDELYEPNAEIGIDNDSLTASIRPYCEDDNGNLIDGVSLSVYRREFDGSFTEIGSGINNLTNTFITDPHPSLDYARYRVVAISNATGAVSYYDMPGYPVGEKSIIIQWDENWTNFDTTNSDELKEPTWAGSMLKLPYNIDISTNHSSDVSLVEYIGRKHPVTYYGTQLGETSTWTTEIAKNDTETLYALRRLAIWMGDVYVREPSGSGYWANVSVSFDQKHLDLTIPVRLSITRVSGGA